MTSRPLPHKKTAKYSGEVSVTDMTNSSITREDLREIFRHEFRTFGREQLRTELTDFMDPLAAHVHDRICKGTSPNREQMEALDSVQIPAHASSSLSRKSLAKTVASGCADLPSLPGTIEDPATDVDQNGAVSRLSTPGMNTETPFFTKDEQISLCNDSTFSPASPCNDFTFSLASPRTPTRSKTTKEMKSGDGKKSGTCTRQSSRVISSHRRASISHSFTHHEYHKSRLHILALKVVSNNVFDLVVAAAILLNGLMVGIQTHIMAVDGTDESPTFFKVVELVFCAIFTVELAIRLYAYRLLFFTMPGMVGWNIFDLIVVVAQLLELLMEAVASGLGFSFNLLRTLRLIRVLRIARTLRLIGELRTIVSSIVSSMKPLFWTGVLLFMIVYVLGVYVTQVVLHKRLSLQDEQQEVPHELALYWGDLIKSVFSLFESITGGVDWDQVARPLIDRIGPEMGVLYSFFITFTMFAMLNVVTGVFIQAVIENGTMESEFRTRTQVKSLFQSLDAGNTGEITWEAFNSQIERKEMREFFKSIDVDIRNAQNLFDLIDIDSSGSVDCDEFLEGCLRIWAPSRGYDQQMILRDVNRLRTDVETWIAEASNRPCDTERVLPESSGNGSLMRVETMSADD